MQIVSSRDLILFEEIKNTFKGFFTQSGFTKFFFISFALYILALFSLFRGDVYYVDDWGSSISGTNWNHFSRFVSTFLYKIIGLSNHFVDLSPFIQIIAVAMLCLSAMVLIYLVRKKFDFWGIFIALPLGLNPYFLENLSYKFDSMMMAFSLMCCVLPFLFKNSNKLFVLFSVLFLVLMYSSYQASNGVYIVLGLFFGLYGYFYENKNIKETMIFFLLLGISFILASLIYKELILVPIDWYVSSSMFPINEIWEGANKNLEKYLELLFLDLKKTTFFYLMILTSIFFVLNFAICSPRKKILAFIFGIIFFIVGLCLSYGAYLALQKPLFEPRAFIGFGAFCAILCIATFSFPKTKILFYPSAVFACLSAYSCIVFSLAYGNALTKQQEYINYRTQLIISDIERVDKSDKKGAGIYYSGSIGFSRATYSFFYDYGQIARRLVIILMNGHWSWGYMPLYHFGANFQGYGSPHCDLAQNKKRYKLLENSYHKIEKSKDHNCYFVTLKGD